MPQPFAEGREARMQRVENTANETAIDVGRHGEQIASLSQRVENGFEAMGEKLSEITQMMRPVAEALNHPDDGLIARVARLEVISKADGVRWRRWGRRMWSVCKPILVVLGMAWLGLRK